PEACPDSLTESLKNDPSCDRGSSISEAKIRLLSYNVLSDLVFNVEAYQEVERGEERTHRGQRRSVGEEGQPYAPVDHFKQTKAEYLGEYSAGKIRILGALHDRMLDEEYEQE